MVMYEKGKEVGQVPEKDLKKRIKKFDAEKEKRDKLEAAEYKKLQKAKRAEEERQLREAKLAAKKNMLTVFQELEFLR